MCKICSLTLCMVAYASLVLHEGGHSAGGVTIGHHVVRGLKAVLPLGGVPGWLHHRGPMGVAERKQEPTGTAESERVLCRQTQTSRESPVFHSSKGKSCLLLEDAEGCLPQLPSSPLCCPHWVVTLPLAANEGLIRREEGAFRGLLRMPIKAGQMRVACPERTGAYLWGQNSCVRPEPGWRGQEPWVLVPAPVSGGTWPRSLTLCAFAPGP